jgi:hypothetical protein
MERIVMGIAVGLALTVWLWAPGVLGVLDRALVPPAPWPW